MTVQRAFLKWPPNNKGAAKRSLTTFSYTDVIEINLARTLGTKKQALGTRTMLWMTRKSGEEFLFDQSNGSPHPDQLYRYPYRNFVRKSADWQKSNAAGYETHSTQFKIDRVMLPLEELLQPLVRQHMLGLFVTPGRR